MWSQTRRLQSEPDDCSLSCNPNPKIPPSPSFPGTSPPSPPCSPPPPPPPPPGPPRGAENPVLTRVIDAHNSVPKLGYLRSGLFLYWSLSPIGPSPPPSPPALSSRGLPPGRPPPTTATRWSAAPATFLHPGVGPTLLRGLSMTNCIQSSALFFPPWGPPPHGRAKGCGATPLTARGCRACFEGEVEESQAGDGQEKSARRALL